MQPPQRDIDGSALPHDHPEILAEDFVIRRISQQQVATDNVTGQRRLSSLVFKASSGANGSMSIDIEKLIVADGLDPRQYVTTPKWTGSVRIHVGSMRQAAFLVGYDPIKNNPYHGGVWGTFNRKSQNELRKASTWFVEIPGVSLDA